MVRLLDAPERAVRSGRRSGRGPLVVVCLVTLLATMNYTAPITVLSQTAAALGAGPNAQLWMINGVALGLAATVLVSGSVADNAGRRRVFLLGAALLGVGSLGCGIAWEPLLFVAGRLLQGLANAAVFAAGLGLLGHAYPTGAERAKATARWGAALGAGIALGPLAAGGLAEVVDWRVYHLVGLVAAAVLVALGVRELDESRSTSPRPIDWAGTATLAAGLALLLVAVTEARGGWLRIPVLLPLLPGLLLLGAFVAVERRSRQPMLELALFRAPLFRLSTFGGLVTGLAAFGPMSLLPTQLQPAMGLGPLLTAAIFAVGSGMAFVVALWMRRFAVGRSSAGLLGAGLLLVAVGDAALLGLVESGTWLRALPGMVVFGIGSGILNAILARLAVESVPSDHAAMGAGAGNTARYVGGALGLALIGTIASPDVRFGEPADVTVGVAALLALVGAIVALTQRRHTAPAA